MKNILIKNGTLLSPVDGYVYVKQDLHIENGKIKAIADQLAAKDAYIIDASGLLVTPGLMDIHGHCFADLSNSIDPDTLGVVRGVSTLFDAGSSGAYNFDAFYEKYITQAKTHIYALLNISKYGLMAKHELDAMEKIDVEAVRRCVANYPQAILGLKVRASASVVGEMGLKPIALGADLAHELHLPLTVHVGNYPPALGEVLDLLDRNDIVTHAFHGKAGGILTDSGAIIPQALAARERGVKFDIGHGAASFSFRVYEQALKQSFPCDFISTDLHKENYNGPVYSLPAVLSKMIGCGESLEDVIHKTTYAVAKQYHLPLAGRLAIGYTADISLLRLDEQAKTVQDAMGNQRIIQKQLQSCITIISKGEQSETFKTAPDKQ